jgi:hypothetical protein
MQEYTPKRRTALVMTGSGSSGAYHAGVLRALDESGVKVDLLVGSGAGVIAAAFGAVAGGAKLSGPEGLWARVPRFFPLRPSLKASAVLLGLSLAVCLLPLPLAILWALLVPLALLIDPLVPGAPWKALLVPPAGDFTTLREVYVTALAAPSFVLWLLVAGVLVRAAVKNRRRLLEYFESPWNAGTSLGALRTALWEVVRGANPAAKAPPDSELGKRYVGLAAENFGQPGFREAVFRVADLDRGDALTFALLQDGMRAAFGRYASRPTGEGREARGAVVDLRTPGYESLLVDALSTGLLPPLLAPVRRLAFPKGGIYGGEVHRLCDATLVGGSGLWEALAAGAEQVIVVTAVPSLPALPPRRRGPRAQTDAAVAALERQAVERDLEEAERMNRIVETLGHESSDGRRAWEDPATGRVFQRVSLYVVRPETRSLGPLELKSVADPRTEVLETLDDLAERGYQDAYRLFVAPVVGASAEGRWRPPERTTVREGQPVEL